MRKPTKVKAAKAAPVKRRKAKMSPEALRKIAKLEKLSAFNKDLLAKAENSIDKLEAMWERECARNARLTTELAKTVDGYNTLASERDALAIIVARREAEDQQILPRVLMTMRDDVQDVVMQGTPAEVADRYLVRSAHRRKLKGEAVGLTKAELADGQTFEHGKQQ